MEREPHRESRVKSAAGKVCGYSTDPTASSPSDTESDVSSVLCALRNLHRLRVLQETTGDDDDALYTLTNEQRDVTERLGSGFDDLIKSHWNIKNKLRESIQNQWFSSNYTFHRPPSADPEACMAILWFVFEYFNVPIAIVDRCVLQKAAIEILGCFRVNANSMQFSDVCFAICGGRNR